MRRLIILSLLTVSIVTLPRHELTALAATCVGAMPCKACSNCKYCKHCAKERGGCGVCRRAR
jgi:hypothetical protein